jgi:mitochondrial import receptor subunit TOM40
MFDGARADLAKSLSHNPVFQVTHAFTLASQTQDPSYNFSSLFIGEKVRLCPCPLIVLGLVLVDILAGHR